MEFNFLELEEKWNKLWADGGLYKVEEDFDNTKYPKGKYYVLDMFPYPSGSGLHVGHPLGYVASDIVSRFKKLNGYNVLHPMGFDAFGLPAEQYAIETGQHPAITTRENIKTFREQLRKMGFSYDWSREVQTMDPKFYKWTQWIFMQLFKSWFNPDTNKAEEILSLIDILNTVGSEKLFALNKCKTNISAAEWRTYSQEEQQKFLMQFRLAYLDYAEVWWCEALSTVLANDEVKDGVSERGGHTVERIKMRQWFLRITSYADRLLEGLTHLDWSDAMKEMQRNWIGKSEGASIKFEIADTTINKKYIDVFTTRPDTIYGATFMVLAPEHALVSDITTYENKDAVQNYIQYVKSRSERDRISDVKKVTGQFTGAYAINPFTEKQIPIYIAEYVLAGYGTGAIMAVPSNDDRDYAFAHKFGIVITQVIDQSKYPNATREDKIGTIINSEIINGLEVKDAIKKILYEIEKRNIGKRKINYRLRDAGYSRQRYWGEPFPVYYKNEIPYLIDESELPLLLPEVESYKPAGAAKSPLSSLSAWINYIAPNGETGIRETDTMPGYAGSSWYMLRYMDVENEDRFVGEKNEKYWRNVDLYIGGTEHAVGHLLYSRMWQKFLFDRGWVHEDEPFKKLVNQGMIQGVSNIFYRLSGISFSKNVDAVLPQMFISSGYVKKYEENTIEPHELANLIFQKKGNTIFTKGDVESIKFHPYKNIYRYVSGHELNIELLKEDSIKGIILPLGFQTIVTDEFLTEDGKILGEFVVEKMSKSKRNVVNPDDVIAEYGADCFRMYEMFLGPLDASKPWDTKGISGVQGFLRKLWRLFIDENGLKQLNDVAPNADELKILHKTIKKVGEDIEKLSFNTAVSACMICVNELTALKCTNKTILMQLAVILAPFAPYSTEELWQQLHGNIAYTFTKANSIHAAKWPQYDETYLVENTFNYAISINGKTRANIELPLDISNQEIEKIVMAHDTVVKWTEGRQPKKIIIVKGKIVNVVV